MITPNTILSHFTIYVFSYKVASIDNSFSFVQDLQTNPKNHIFYIRSIYSRIEQFQINRDRDYFSHFHRIVFVYNNSLEDYKWLEGFINKIFLNQYHNWFSDIQITFINMDQDTTEIMEKIKTLERRMNG